MKNVTKINKVRITNNKCVYLINAFCENQYNLKKMNFKVNNFILCFYLLLAFTSANAQTHPLPFNQTSLRRFSQGEYLNAGYLVKNQMITANNLLYESVKTNEFSITKFNKRNKKAWQENFHIPYYSVDLIDIKSDSNSDIYILGAISENDNNLGFYLIKLKRNGKILWSKTMRYSEDFSGKNSTTSMYIKSGDVIVLNKVQITDNDTISQVNFFCFDKKGDSRCEFAAETSNNIIGSSIDSKGFIYILCGKVNEQNASIEAIVNLADVFENFKKVNSNKFQFEEYSFIENSKTIDTLHFNEINLFEGVKQNNVNVSFFPFSETSFVKIKSNTKPNNDLTKKMFINLGASISDVSPNLWNDNKMVDIEYDDDGDGKSIFSLYMKKTKDFEDFRFKTEKDKLQKLKSDFTVITALNSCIYNIVQVEKYILNGSEVIDF